MSNHVARLRKKNRARRELDTFHRLHKKYGGKEVLGSFEVLSGILQHQEQIGRFKDLSVHETERLFCRHAVVFACVNKITSSFIEADMQIGSGQGDDFEALENHPMLALFQRPNPDMSQAEFLTRFLLHLLVTGVSYIWEIRNNATHIGQLWPIPTSWVERRFVKGFLDHYRIQMGQGKHVEVPLDDMTVVGFPDPQHAAEFCGPLQAATRELQVDEERGNYLIEMLLNMHAPGAILHQPEGWSPEQKREARAVLQEKIGLGNRGGPLFMDGEGAKFEMMAPLKDLDWPGITALAETRICACFGVPPIVISLISGIRHGTYSNYEQALRAFWQGVMPPLWTMVGDAFTRGLLQNEGDPDNRFHFDFSNIPQLQEDATQRSDRATKLLMGSVITRNEARGMVGFDELKTEVGDVLLVPASMIETPISGLPFLDFGDGEEGDDSQTSHNDDDEDDKSGSGHDGDDAVDDTKELFGDDKNTGHNGSSRKKKKKKKVRANDKRLAGQTS